MHFFFQIPCVYLFLFMFFFPPAYILLCFSRLSLQITLRRPKHIQQWQAGDIAGCEAVYAALYRELLADPQVQADTRVARELLEVRAAGEVVKPAEIFKNW